MFRSNVSSKFHYFVGKCLMKILGRSALGEMVGNILGGCPFESVLTIWYISLLEDARVIPSVYSLHLAVCTSFETLRFACLYNSLKIVNFVSLHFLSALCLSLLAIESSSLIGSNHGEEL